MIGADIIYILISALLCTVAILLVSRFDFLTALDSSVGFIWKGVLSVFVIYGILSLILFCILRLISELHSCLKIVFIPVTVNIAFIYLWLISIVGLLGNSIMNGGKEKEESTIVLLGIASILFIIFAVFYSKFLHKEGYSRITSILISLSPSLIPIIFFGGALLESIL